MKQRWSIDRYHHERRDLQIDVQNYLLARLRGREPRGGASIFNGCSLDELRILTLSPGTQHLAGTSSDFVVALTDAVTVLVGERYHATEAAYRSLSSPIRFNSTRQATIVRPGEFPSLQLVGEGGEVTQAVPPDGGERITLLRYARIYSLTSVAIANDDAGALSLIIQQAADAVTFAENGVFFATLLSNAGAGPTLTDGTAYFHSSRGNLLSAAAISSTSLGTALAALRKQSAPGGAKLNLRGRFLVCGPDAEGLAHAAVAALTAPGSPGPLLDVLVDSNITDTSWFVFADPAIRPAFYRGFLNVDGPDITRFDTFEVEGVSWKVRTTFGVAPYDWRCVVRNPGA